MIYAFYPTTKTMRYVISDPYSPKMVEHATGLKTTLDDYDFIEVPEQDVRTKYIDNPEGTYQLFDRLNFTLTFSKITLAVNESLNISGIVLNSTLKVDQHPVTVLVDTTLDLTFDHPGTYTLVFAKYSHNQFSQDIIVQ